MRCAKLNHNTTVRCNLQTHYTTPYSLWDCQHLHLKKNFMWSDYCSTSTVECPGDTELDTLAFQVVTDFAINNYKEDHVRVVLLYMHCWIHIMCIVLYYGKTWHHYLHQYTWLITWWTLFLTNIYLSLKNMMKCGRSNYNSDKNDLTTSYNSL